MLFICYPQCSTCRRARQWLDDRGIEYEFRNIKTDSPTMEELREWHAKSGIPLRRFFNTSGLQYRSLKLKDRLHEMSEEEQYELLASDGMLVRRPVLVGPDSVLVGFKEAEWEEALRH